MKNEIEEKQIYYRITPESEPPCVFEEQDFSEALKDWVDICDVGDKFTVERVEMTREEFESLGDYEE